MNHEMTPAMEPKFRDYLIFSLIIGGIIAVAFVVWRLSGGEGLNEYMRYLMGVFFVTFASFKLASYQDFYESYQAYDLIARRWPVWGHIYPFIEMALGILYLFGLLLTPLNWFTLGLLSIGALGVLKTLSSGRRVKCACLGSFVNLPLSTVSLIEDLSMAVMAAWLLL